MDNGQLGTGQAAEARACQESISDGQSDHVLVSYLKRCCTPLDSMMVALVVGLPGNGLQGDSLKLKPVCSSSVTSVSFP